MAILISNEILNALYHELKNANESVQIISAYCKAETIEQLNNMIRKNVKDRRLMVRFRMDDVIKGSTDFEAIEYCMRKNWKVFFRFDLHAKTYIVDNKRGIIASANATNSGLGMSERPNLEMATLANIEFEDIGKINRLYEYAIAVDENLLSKMKVELSNISGGTGISNISWSKEINDRFQPKVETLFSYELPENDAVDGYLSFLDCDFNGDISEIKKTFRWSNAYLWLLDAVKSHGGEVYFGQLSADLHNALVSDPKPYRKDVKQLLANLLAFIDKLEMDEVIVDRPNYSQRIRLIRKN